MGGCVGGWGGREEADGWVAPAPACPLVQTTPARSPRPHQHHGRLVGRVESGTGFQGVGRRPAAGRPPCRLPPPPPPRPPRPPFPPPSTPPGHAHPQTSPPARSSAPQASRRHRWTRGRARASAGVAPSRVGTAGGPGRSPAASAWGQARPGQGGGGGGGGGHTKLGGVHPPCLTVGGRPTRPGPPRPRAQEAERGWVDEIRVG